MKQEEVEKLKSLGYNLIPLTRSFLADLETPLSIYLKLCNKPFTYLFESVQGGEKWGRYSIIGLGCSTILKVFSHTITVEIDGVVHERENHANPLDFISTFLSRFKVAPAPNLPRFNGGLVGYFGYDTVRFFEKKKFTNTPPDTLKTPDILLFLSKDLAIFDNLSNKITFVTHIDATKKNDFKYAQDRLENWIDLVSKLSSENNQNYCPIHLPDQAIHKNMKSSFTSSFNRMDFENAVKHIKEYVLAGDCLQVVLSQRLSAPFHKNPLDLYRVLRYLNPSPYMYYLNLQDFQIVGCSPEILVRLEDGEVTVRPMAGTRKRGRTEEEDATLERELLADAKECAEHLMLIDLGRNDVGKIAQPGSVKVTEMMVVERYSHVMHIVSQVVGKLSENSTIMDVLMATLPAGTLSGAPKIRAMEIIDELEPEKRSIYGGAVGYLSWSGNLDTAIAIRTAIIKNRKLFVQAGAGVVADSDPKLEWQETMNKAMAIFDALSLLG